VRPLHGNKEVTINEAGFIHTELQHIEVIYEKTNKLPFYNDSKI
jgi:hypothetical protein